MKLRDKPLRMKVVGPNLGIWGLVGLATVLLRAFHIVEWPWWVALMPLYLPLVLFIVMSWGMYAILSIVILTLIEPEEDKGK